MNTAAQQAFDAYMQALENKIYFTPVLFFCGTMSALDPVGEI
jgi:hypothetical protein